MAEPLQTIPSAADSATMPPADGTIATADDSLPRLRDALKTKTPEEALSEIQEWLIQNPLSHEGFAILGEAFEAVGDFNASIVALQRALYLQKFNHAQRPCDALNRLRDLEAFANRDSSALTLAGKTFPRLIRSRSQERLRYTARSHDGLALLKLEISDPGKNETLPREAEWLEKLNASGSLAVPRLLGQGRVPIEELRAALPQAEQVLVANQNGFASYLVCEYVPASSGYGIADVALALMELKRSGAYPGYLTPRSIHFDTRAGVCKFVDFSRAEWLSDELRAKDDRDYFAWCNERPRPDHVPHFLAGFPNVDLDRNFWPLFDGNGSFELTRTYPFQSLRVCAEGFQSMGDLKIPGFQSAPRDSSSGTPADPPAFERLSLAAEESVLVLNSPMNLHAVALAMRGCRVATADLQFPGLEANRVLERIRGLRIDPLVLDPNHIRFEARFDTVLFCNTPEDEIRAMLALNARAFSECCRRILIEIPGARPEEGKSATGLANALAPSLPDFNFSQTCGGNGCGSAWLEFARSF